VETKEIFFGYNGSLFEKDERLDSLTIDNDVLEEVLTTLSKYDFESDVDVNILGHIFEHNLFEEEHKNKGVFYTPTERTEDIVKNSIGELCQDKKKVLEIENLCIEGIELKNPKQVKILHGKVQKYRNWLLQLSVCDPACGSGALLNMPHLTS